MPAKLKMALAAVLVAASAGLALGSAATALADSVDGKPTDRADRHPPASLRGSPAILFENRGAQSRPHACATDDVTGRSGSCAAGDVF